MDGIWGRVQAEVDARQGRKGMSPFDLLELPEPERGFMKKLLKKRVISLSDAAAELEQSEAEAAQTLREMAEVQETIVEARAALDEKRASEEALKARESEAEKRLWWKVKMRQMKGLIFYRQKPIGKYIVDFYCPKAKLAIEIDGSQHLVGETIEYDRIRDDYLDSLGLRVLRFNNAEVLTNMSGVLEKIEEEIEMKIPLNPSLRRRETDWGKAVDIRVCRVILSLS